MRGRRAFGGLFGLALAGTACAPVYSETVAPPPAPLIDTAERPASSGALATILGSLVWPLATDRATILSSAYGDRTDPRGEGRRFHAGLDLRAPEGTPVYAVAAGRVTRSDSGGGYGHHVVIDHGAGLESLYAHHARNLVGAGDPVRRGQVIALVGNTGNATGDHLHFELRWRGGTVNPRTVLPLLGPTGR